MHKRILSILLAFLMAQPVFCLAKNYDNVKEGTIPLTILNEHGDFTNKTLDIEYLKFMKFALKKNEPFILGRSKGCKFSIDQDMTKDNIYEKVLGLITLECGKDFEVSVSSGTDEDLNFYSEEGKAAFLVPLGEVNASFTGSGDTKCEGAFVGIGKSELAKEGYQFKLDGCNSGSTLNPILAGVIAVATLFLSLF